MSKLKRIAKKEEIIKEFDYQIEYKKQLKENILNVRKQINNHDFVIKIKNHAEKYNREVEEVKLKIMEDDMFAEIFAKDPTKQNIYENLAAKYIKNLPIVKEFRKLPNNSKMFVVNGEISTKRENDVKSIDFTFKVKNKTIYASHKYIKAFGGAQDNQYNDIRTFLRNCNKLNQGDIYFIAICDGPYFETKIKNLIEEFGSNNVAILNIYELENFLNSL